MIRIFLLVLLSSCNSGVVDDSSETSTTASSGDLRTVDEEGLSSEALASKALSSKSGPPCQSMQPFKSLWKVDADDKITLPLPSISGWGSYGYKFTVDWGDGKTSRVTSHDDPDASHIYTVASADAEGDGVHKGNYRVTITGLLEAWSFDGKECDKFVAIEDLGNTCLKSLRGAFRGCKKLTQVKGGNTSEVTDLSYAFYQAGDPDGSLKLHINSWDTSKVISMTQMFTGAEGITFECDEGDDCDDEANLKNWQTANVSNMYGMFKNSKAINPDVSNWRTDNLTNVEMMFHRSTANPDVSNWNFNKIRKFKDFVTDESAIDNENYCKLIIALGENIPSSISTNAGHKSLSMPEKNCANLDNVNLDTVCRAKQSLKENGWKITDASCPQQ